MNNYHKNVMRYSSLIPERCCNTDCIPAGVMVSLCKRFAFVIRSLNNLKTARHRTVNQSENGYD